MTLQRDHQRRMIAPAKSRKASMWRREASQREVVLALGMGEELDRLDVGVAVDDAAGERRNCASAIAAERAPDRRHQSRDGDDVGDDPAAPIGAISQASSRAKSETRAGEVDDERTRCRR